MNRAERRRMQKAGVSPNAFALQPDGTMLSADGKTPLCMGQHTGCPACMAYYLKHYANTCTYGKGKT